MSAATKSFFKYCLCLHLPPVQDTFVTSTGNMPSEDKIERLATGMPQEQVREILGSPSSVVFSWPQHMDLHVGRYRTNCLHASQETERRLLVVKFDDSGKVADIKHIGKSKAKNCKSASGKRRRRNRNKASSANISAVSAPTPIAPSKPEYNWCFYDFSPENRGCFYFICILFQPARKRAVNTALFLFVFGSVLPAVAERAKPKVEAFVVVAEGVVA